MIPVDETDSIILELLLAYVGMIDDINGGLALE